MSARRIEAASESKSSLSRYRRIVIRGIPEICKGGVQFALRIDTREMSLLKLGIMTMFGKQRIDSACHAVQFMRAIPQDLCGMLAIQRDVAVVFWSCHEYSSYRLLPPPLLLCTNPIRWRSRLS